MSDDSAVCCALTACFCLRFSEMLEINEDKLKKEKRIHNQCKLNTVLEFILKERQMYRWNIELE